MTSCLDLHHWVDTPFDANDLPSVDDTDTSSAGTTIPDIDTEWKLTFIPLLGAHCVVSPSSPTVLTSMTDDKYDDECDLSYLTHADDADSDTTPETECELTRVLFNEVEQVQRIWETNTNKQCHETTNEDRSAILNAAIAADMAEDQVRQMSKAMEWLNDASLLEIDDDEEEIQQDGHGDNNDEWHSYWSEAHGRMYYYNRITRRSSWTKPCRRVKIDITGVKDEVRREYVADVSMNKSTTTESTSCTTTCIQMECEWESFESMSNYEY